MLTTKRPAGAAEEDNRGGKHAKVTVTFEQLQGFGMTPEDFMELCARAAAQETVPQQAEVQASADDFSFFNPSADQGETFLGNEPSSENADTFMPAPGPNKLPASSSGTRLALSLPKQDAVKVAPAPKQAAVQPPPKQEAVQTAPKEDAVKLAPKPGRVQSPALERNPHPNHFSWQFTLCFIALVVLVGYMYTVEKTSRTIQHATDKTAEVATTATQEMGNAFHTTVTEVGGVLNNAANQTAGLLKYVSEGVVSMANAALAKCPATEQPSYNLTNSQVYEIMQQEYNLYQYALPPADTYAARRETTTVALISMDHTEKSQKKAESSIIIPSTKVMEQEEEDPWYEFVQYTKNDLHETFGPNLLDRFSIEPASGAENWEHITVNHDQPSWLSRYED